MAEIIQFSPFAINDIEEVWNYTAERNVDAAVRLMCEFRQKFELIARNPVIGRSRDDLIIGLRQFPHKNYHIYYFPIDNGVEIYRVLHSSRNRIQIFDDTIDSADKA